MRGSADKYKEYLPYLFIILFYNFPPKHTMASWPNGKALLSGNGLGRDRGFESRRCRRFPFGLGSTTVR